MRPIELEAIAKRPPGPYCNRSVVPRDKNVVVWDGKKRKILNREATRARERYLICLACEDSRDDGAACVRYAACCFGRWRSNEQSRCPAGKW